MNARLAEHAPTDPHDSKRQDSGPLRNVGHLLALGVGEIFKGVLIGVGATILLAFMAPAISESLAYVNPTCDDPRGVRAIPPSEIEAYGQAYVDEDHFKYSPAKVLDGNPGSIWSPLRSSEEASQGSRLAVFAAEEADRTLRLEFDRERDIALVCVVNGLTNERWRYRNWGRVKNIAAWPDDSEDRLESTLKTLDEGEIQTFSRSRSTPGL